jgi:hypothetical protein
MHLNGWARQLRAFLEVDKMTNPVDTVVGEQKIQRVDIAFPSVIGAVPWLLVALTYVVAPGYMGPYFHTTIGMVTTCLMLSWNILGFFIFCKMRSNTALKVVWGTLGLPFLLVPMLGPAIVTIVSALSF